MTKPIRRRFMPGSMLRKVLLFVAMVIPGAARAEPQTDTSADRTAAVRALVEGDAPSQFLNGGLLVVEHGRTLYRADTGLAEFRTRARIGPNSVFQTASMSKPFTSVAILQLRDAGRLRLDNPVVAYLPGFPFRDITLRHLLSHTSGLPDLELFEGMVSRDSAHVVTGADLIPALRGWSTPLPFQPGERFRYSNINYQLLAQVVERVSRQPFGSYVRNHIFQPAGMRSSYVLGIPPIAPTGQPPVVDHEHVLMYRTLPEDVSHLQIADARKLRPYRYELGNLGRTVGDQNLVTTMDDLARFDRALLNNRILSARSQAEAYTPVRLNDGTTYLDAEEYQLYGVRCSYGLGWEVCAHPRYGQLVGHAGFNRGIQTVLYRNPARRQLIVMFDNGDTPDFAGKFAAVTRIVNGDPAPPLERRLSLARAYGETLVRDGPTAALLFYLNNRERTDRWIVSRQGMNILGYDLLRNGYPALALEPFRLNVLNHPVEASVWDSLGDGLSANGRRIEAAQAYRRSLELNPTQQQTSDKLRALEVALPASGH